jgi:radical SAM/Cys-rich protein
MTLEIPETNVVTDTGPRPSLASLLARRSPLVNSATQLETLHALPLDAEFGDRLSEAGVDFSPRAVEFFQLNVGKLCNMTCRHCHVDAGPDRTDAMMSDDVVEAALRVLDQTDAHTVDITGGAPELHPRFKDIVRAARARGKHVIDRCNLTILLLPKFADMVEFLAENQVEIVCSLPHYRARNTDAQRGDGTFERSIKALRILNEAGYGKGDPSLRLTLMSNPSGAFLGGDQNVLEGQWKQRLKKDFDIDFDRLFVLNNMPISRYLEWLVDSGNLQQYMERLVAAYNPAAAAGVMCLNTISISYDGRVFDCDFNQMLDMDARRVDDGSAFTVHNFDAQAFAERRILVDRHCFGCTAGAGSSCGGSTS